MCVPKKHKQQRVINMGTLTIYYARLLIMLMPYLHESTLNREVKEVVCLHKLELAEDCRVVL